MQRKVKKALIKALKVTGWVLGSIIFLILIVIALVQIPAVQQKITQKAITFLENKIGTEVAIESLYISFPKNIVLKGLYIEDQSKDTLLYAGKLSVNTDLWALTRNEIQLNDIILENTTAYVNRAENDSAFNFTYIINAFAGDSTAVPDTLEQKAWDFSIKTIELEGINAHYHDKLTGNNVDLKLGTFELSMNEFDLKNYIFSVDEITLEDTKIDFIQTKPPVVTKAAAEQTVDTIMPDLDVSEIALKNIEAKYTQQVTGQVIRLDLGETVLNANKIDLKNQLIDLDDLSLKNTFLAYQQLSGKTPGSRAPTAPSTSRMSKASASALPPSGKTDNWKIKLDKLDLENNSIQFYDFNKTNTPSEIDFDHLWVTNLNATARDLVYDSPEIHLDLQNFSLHEKSGFSLQSLQTIIKVSEDSASIEGFALRTANSKIQIKADAGFNSFEQLRKNYAEADIHAEIKPSTIGLRDILYFKNALMDSLPLNLDPHASIAVDALIDGTLKDLLLHHFNIRALTDTYLKANGRIVGIPDPEKISLDMELEKFYTTRNDVVSILPDTLLPDSIALPEWINVRGTYKGNGQKAVFNANITSAIGAIDVNGNMNLDSTSATRGFSGKVAVNEFDLGELLMQPQTIGKLNLQASLNSEGITKEEMNSVVEATVKSFEYKDYRYENLTMNASIKNDILKGQASLKDPNLDFVLEGDYNFQGKVPKYDFTFDLKNADFKALNLSVRPLKTRGTLDVDMATADFKILNGSVGIRKVAVFNGDALYAVDSLLFASIDQEGRSEIKIDSDIMKGSFEGTLNIFEMPAVLREYFNTYYSLNDSVEQSYEAPQHFTFDLELKKTELITDILIPELSSFEPGEIKGEFDSQEKQLNLKFDIANISYANISVGSFLLATNSNTDALNFNVFVNKIRYDSLLVDGIQFNGTVSHDSLRTDFIVLDSMARHKYVIGGTFFSREDVFEFKLNPEQVRLNYQDWAVPYDNFIRFGGEKLVARNVELVNRREKIIIESKEEPGSPLFIGFRELNLEYLASMISYEKPLSGLLHGDINIFPEKDNFRFTSDITISDFSIAAIEWGDLALQVAQKPGNRFDVNFSLTGSKNDIRTQGYYVGGETPSMDIITNLSKFDLSVLDPITASQFQRLKGSLTGEIRVSGTPKEPEIDGDITLRNTEFFSVFLKSAFSIKDETISLTDQGILFDEFQLADARNNIASLDGLITTKDYRNFGFRLSLNTSNFRLLNTTEKDNDLFYGLIDINANARISGTMVNPVVDTEISLSEGSNLTYIVPQSEASILEQQGIVKFVDKTFKADPFMKKIQRELSDTVKSTFTGIDLTAKIELSDKETLTVVIDPTTNDQLTVKGNTTLTLQMDQTGDMQLAGRYEITEGTYNLSFYKFVKREFQIEKGSTMTWSGDPLNAGMDIHAIYKIDTSPIDLLANQIQATNPEQMSEYKQRLPFLVYLNITGQLLKPDISFRLDMPMEKRNALYGIPYARILDINTRESDLNKQVFALLILRRFISDNPFETQGGGFEGTARTSVSKILTEQLNRLSENVKGVELSFDVKSYEDYSTGEGQGQTELQLGLSKSLLNDRLVVKLSGNIDIEGENTNREVTDYIGDLALEYMLTEDGRFRITGFRNSNYDMIDGELTETGAGLIYIKDYNTLSELFKANAKEK